MHSRNTSQDKVSPMEMRKSISSSHLTSNSQYHQQYLSGLIKCPICQNRIKQAQMCPSCCKLFCLTCIRDWILSKKPECPSCIRPLHYSSIINCDILGKQISELFEVKTFNSEQSCAMTSSPSFEKELTPNYSSPDLNIKSSPNVGSQNQCKQHGLSFQYFCQTCCEGICSDCAVLTNKHSGHKLCKLVSKRIYFQNMVNQLRRLIEEKKNQVQQKVQYYSHNLLNIRTLQTQKLSVLLNYLKRVRDNTHEKMQKCIKVQEKFYQNDKKELDECLSSYEKLQKQVQTPVKSKFIVESQKYESNLKSLATKQQKIVQKRKRISQNMITPNYDKKVFILDNYTHLKGKNDVLYSQPFFWKNIEWKLKIYPGGLHKDQSEQYLAMYLEMTKGYANHNNLYEYKIELINQIQREKTICRTFENEFGEGQSWGYDSFAKISTLYEDKYVHPEEDYLQIILHVRTPTFYHAVRDQDYEISRRQKLKEQNMQKIRVLRKLASQKGIDILEKQNTFVVRALIDQALEPKVNLQKVRSHSNISSLNSI